MKMVILNGTKNCQDHKCKPKRKMISSLPHTHTHPPIHGQSTETSSHLWHGNSLLSLPQSVQENNPVTPKMPETLRMDKLL